MTPTGSNKSLQRKRKAKIAYSLIHLARDEIKDSSSGKKLETGYSKLMDQVKDATKGGVLEDILELEIYILEDELLLFADDKDHEASLKLGIHQIKTALNRLDFVRDPEGYQIYDQRHVCHDKNRTNGLPKIDPGRQGLASHKTRLQNPKRVDLLTSIQKEVLSERVDSIKFVLTEFINLQKLALGPDRKKTQEESINVG